MSCEWFEARLDELLDARRDPVEDAKIRAHARECSGCRATLAAQRQWLMLLPQALAAENCESIGLVTGPADERVARRRLATAAVWRRWTAVLSSLAVVAGLVLVIVLEGGRRHARNAWRVRWLQPAPREGRGELCRGRCSGPGRPPGRAAERLGQWLLRRRHPRQGPWPKGLRLP